MENKQEGDVFISRLTGRKAITVLGSSGRCCSCIYNRLGSKGGQIGCFGAYHDLRREEAGQCSSKSRGDHKNVYFKEVEKLYDLTKETVELMIDLQTDSTLSTVDKINLHQLLLDAEYEQQTRR